MPLPAAWATTPKIEKMPAPTMPPMPMAMAEYSPMPPAAGGLSRLFPASGIRVRHKKSLLCNLLDMEDLQVQPRTRGGRARHRA